MTKNQTNKKNNLKIKIDDIKDFLEKNPKIFRDKPELYEFISPPSRSKNNIIDIQQHMIESLQKNISKLKKSNSELISLSKENQISQEKINNVVLETLKASSLDELFKFILYNSEKLLDIDYVNIIFEKTENSEEYNFDKKIVFVESKQLKPFIKEDDYVFLSKTSRNNEFFFTGAQEKILSSAIIKLKLYKNSPAVFLVLGSKESEKFNERQGTELLKFLREALNSYFKLWLNQ